MKKLSQITDMHKDLTKVVDFFDYEKYHQHHIGLTRDQMPQIYNEHLSDVIGVLNDRFGVTVERKPLNYLKATQCEVNKDKIKAKILSPLTNLADLQFIVSDSYHIADGHHSHVAGLCVDKSALCKVYRVNTDTKTMIDTLNSLVVTDNKTINESKI